MQILKGVVIILGLAIISMMGVIGYGIVQKFNDPGFSFFSASPTLQQAAPAQVAPSPSNDAAIPGVAAGAIPRTMPDSVQAVSPRTFGTEMVAIPPGARLSSLVADGDRLLLHMTLADGREDVVVVDLQSGSVLGRLELR